LSTVCLIFAVVPPLTVVQGLRTVKVKS